MDQNNFSSRNGCEDSLLAESCNLIKEHEKSILLLQRLKEEKEIGVNFSSSLRSGSQISTDSSNKDICRICHCESEDGIPLIAPCYCSGSLRYVHQACLQQWIKSSDTKSCELCKFSFIMHTKTKPFNKWEKLEMSSIERRKLFCSVTFHAVAITCVIWSLYVLIDRTAEEVQAGMLEWPFWTKLIVVAIGFTGGIVFMYVQCKMYAHLCRRWQAYNRVIYVQNAPEKMPLSKSDFIKVESVRGSVDSGTDVGQGSLASGGDKDPTESSHLMADCNVSQKSSIKSKMEGSTARTFLERLTLSGKSSDTKDDLNKSRLSDGKLPLVINVQSLDLKTPKFGAVEICSVFDDIGSSGESSQDISQQDSRKENLDTSLATPYCEKSFVGFMNQSLNSLDNLEFQSQST